MSTERQPSNLTVRLPPAFATLPEPSPAAALPPSAPSCPLDRRSRCQQSPTTRGIEKTASPCGTTIEHAMTYVSGATNGRPMDGQTGKGQPNATKERDAPVERGGTEREGVKVPPSGHAPSQSRSWCGDHREAAISNLWRQHHPLRRARGTGLAEPHGESRGPRRQRGASASPQGQSGPPGHREGPPPAGTDTASLGEVSQRQATVAEHWPLGNIQEQ